MGEHEMCIDQKQFNELRDLQLDVTSTLVGMNTKLAGMDKSMGRVEEAVFGNGSVGLRTEVEVLKVLTGLKDEHIEEIVDTKLGQKIDWKWVGMILLQAGLLAFVALQRIP